MAYGSLKVDQLQTSTQTLSIDALATKASPALTGTPTAPTAAVDTNTTQVATTAFVAAQGYSKLATAQSFTAAQRGSLSALTTVSGTVTPNFNQANNFSLTLSTASTSIANPTNLVAGQSGVILITQSAGTLCSLSWGNYWKWAGGSANAPNATQTASAVDLLVYFVESTSRISARMVKDFK